MIRPRLVLALALAAAPVGAAEQRTQPVLVAPAPQWPAPVVRTLENGLTVAVFTQHRLPIVQMQLALPAGTAAEDTSQLGAAPLAASLLRAGTSSRTSQQFQRDLDQLGGVFAASVTRDQAIVSAGFLSSDFENGMELFSDAIVNPIFPEEEFELARRSAARQLGQSRTQLWLAADDRAWTAAYSPHPYGRPPAGTVVNLLRMRRDALQTFHRDYWRPDRAILVVAGDVEPERAFAVADEWFRRWTGRARVIASLPPAPPRAGVVHLVDLPGSPQVEVRLAMATPGRAGTAGPSWGLFSQAATASGALPAPVRANWMGLHDAGLFTLGAGGAVDSAAALVRTLRRAWSGLASAPPSASAIGRALDEQRAAAPLTVETLGGLATAWQTGRLAGLPDDHLATASDRLAASAEREPMTAIATALASAPLLVVVGPAAKLREAMAEFGAVEVQPFDEIAAPRDTVPQATEEQLSRGRKVMDATLRAHGGAARLAAVRGVFVAGEMTVQMGDRAVEGEFEQLRSEPDRFSFVTRLLDFPSRQVLVGDRAWGVSGAGQEEVIDADSLGVRSLRAVFESDLLHSLLRADETDARAAWMGTEMIGSRLADLVEFHTRSGGRARLVVDGATKRVVAIDGAPSPDGVWHERRTLSDLRAVDGLWLPFREERRVDGTLINAFRAKTIVVNPTVNEEIFRRPSAAE